MNNESIFNSHLEIIEKAIVGGCKFASFVYRAKETGELARHTIALGVSIERAYRRDRQIVSGYLAHAQSDGVQAMACRQILNSLNESLTKGVGNNSAYTNIDTYAPIGRGVKFHKETKEIYISGFSIKKNVIEEGVYKKIKSSEIVLAKKALKKRMKSGRFRQFCLSNIGSVRIEGKTIVLDMDI